MVSRTALALIVAFVCCAGVGAADSAAETIDEPPPQQLELADGLLAFTLPGTWEKVEPRSRIVEHEFALPPADGQSQSGRMTMMRSGGGVKANINRWKGQFEIDREVDPQDALQVQETKIDGITVHLVDFRGTYLDRRRPFGPGTPRPGYRMLGAIVQTPEAGDYFVKFYAPEATVDTHAEAFEAMISKLEWRGRKQAADSE